MATFATSTHCTDAPLGVTMNNLEHPKHENMKVLNEKEVVQRLRDSSDTCGGLSTFISFYSSIIGAAVTEKHLAVFPADDHLVHRGHGVFDTVTIRNGKAYQLDQHVQRFLGSATAAEIDYKKAGYTSQVIKELILAVVAVGAQQDQDVRYWLSVGRGDFGISTQDCSKANFYCLCERKSPLPDDYYQKGVKLITSTIPMKQKRFANAKTTNYLANALVVSEAERAGAWQGVWTTPDGFVAELATYNIGFSFKENSLVVPPFDRTLCGISVSRALELCKTHLGVETEIREVTLSEAKTAREVLLFGGDLSALPAVKWDEDIIGDGLVGSMAKKLRDAQLRDHFDGWGDEGQLQEVPGLQNVV